METTNYFDLNHAIQQWRDGLAQSPGIRPENLNELEAHLRDSVSVLQARDLSAEESFLVATKRVGGGAVLEKEFGKVNSQVVWIERVLWALVIMQLWETLQGLGNSLAYIVSRSSHFPPMLKAGEINGWIGFVAIVAIPAISLILPALLVWRFFESPQSWVRKKLEKLSSQPFILAISLLVLSLAVHFLLTFGVSLTVSQNGRATFPIWNYFSSIPLNLFYAGAVFVLARKRLLRIA
jgi:hypothetical protein